MPETMKIGQPINSMVKNMMRSIKNNKLFKALVNNLILYPAAYLKIWKRKITIRKPDFFIYNIELTNKCPMKCIMCARTHQMTRDQGVLDFEIFKKAIDEMLMLNPKAAKSMPLWLHHF